LFVNPIYDKTSVGEEAINELAQSERMKELIKTTLHTSKFLALIKEGHWDYVDRVNATGAALILAVTPAQSILLVEQYRIPVHTRTIELPAGIIGDEPGDANESQAAAARRELLEETGYEAERFEALTTGAACSGITSERVTLFRATGLRRIGKGGGVAHEDIIVHEVPLAEVTAWLEAKAKTGVLIDPKVYAGLFFAGSPISALNRLQTMKS
jgi:ADP-ribose pyrophosphatase